MSTQITADQIMQALLSMPKDKLDAIKDMAKTASDMPPLIKSEIVDGTYGGKPVPVLNLSIPLFFPGTPVGEKSTSRLLNGTRFRQSVPLGSYQGKVISGGFTVWAPRETDPGMSK